MRKSKKNEMLNTIGLLVTAIIMSLLLTVFYYQPQLLRGALLLSDETSIEEVNKWAYENAHAFPKNITMEPESILLRPGTITPVELNITDKSEEFFFYKDAILFLAGSDLHWPVSLEGPNLSKDYFEKSAIVKFNLSEKVKPDSKMVLFMKACERYEEEGTTYCDLKDYFLSFTTK